MDLTQPEREGKPVSAADALSEALAQQEYAYLTTAGRVTGKPHEIEIWFAARGRTIYMLAGGGHRSDWVKNIARNPSVQVRIGEQTLAGTAEIIEDGGARLDARRLIAAKYQGWCEGARLSDWARRALLVAIKV